jgi:hypothetical protein
MVLTVSIENGRLSLDVPNMGKLALTPNSELTFAVQGVDATATFLKDEKGEITQLIFHTRRATCRQKRKDEFLLDNVFKPQPCIRQQFLRRVRSGELDAESTKKTVNG